MKKILKVILLLLCVLDCGAQTKDMNKIKNQRQSTQKEIKDTSNKLNTNKKQTKVSLAELQSISADLERHTQEVNSLSSNVTAIEDSLGNMTVKVSESEKKLATLRAEYANVIVQMSRKRGSFNKLMFLFSASSVRQAYSRMHYLQQFAQWRKDRVNEIKAANETLIKQRSELASLHNHKVNNLTELTKVQTTIAQKKEKQAVVVANLKKENTELQKQLKKQQKEARDLDNKLNRMIAEQERIAQEKARKERAAREAKAKEEAKRKAEELKKQQQKEKATGKEPVKGGEQKTSEPKRPKKEEPKTEPIKQGGYEMDAQERSLSGSFESNKGSLPYPLSGKCKIVQHFGRQRHPELQYVETENGGIDIETTPGNIAKAVFAGKVSAIFVQPGFNAIVMVRHGNYLTIYANLTDVYVKSGDTVKANQNLGKIFSDAEDGNRTILHFEVRKEKTKLNPEAWIR